MRVLLQRARENNCLHARHRSVSLLRHHLKCVASHQQRVKLLEKPGEIDLRVHDNPVGLTLRPRNVSIQTHRHLVSYSPHGLLPRISDPYTWPLSRTSTTTSKDSRSNF